MPRVFISYARKDGSTLARQLYQAFNLREGWSAWMDPDIRAERDFTVEIEIEIQKSDCVVVVISPDVNRFEPESFVLKELHYARQDGIKKPIFPVRAEPCFIPLIVSGPTWVDFYGEDYSFEGKFRELIGNIEKLGRITALSPIVREGLYLQSLMNQSRFWSRIYTDLKVIAKGPLSIDTSVRGRPEVPTYWAEKFKGVTISKEAFSSYTNNEHQPQFIRLNGYSELMNFIRGHDRIALLGEPGSGKSTTLSRIAYDLAANALDGTIHSIPLLCTLGNFGKGTFHEHIAAHFGDLQIDDYLASRIILLLDGLNETNKENREQIQKWLQDHPNTPVVITCRTLDFAEQLDGFVTVTILPLDVFQIQEFMLNWGLSSEATEKLFWSLAGPELEEIWWIWKEVGDTFKTFWTEHEILPGMAAHAKTLSKQDAAFRLMHKDLREKNQLPGLLGLMTNPFLLELTSYVFSTHGSVPQKRGELFNNYTSELISQHGRHAITAERPWIDEDIQRRGFIILSMQLQGRATYLDIDEAHRLLVEACAEVNSIHLIDFGLSATILVLDGNQIRFSHQLLQEYFASFAMIEDMRNGVSAEKYWHGQYWSSRGDPPDVLGVGPETTQSKWWSPSGWEDSAVLCCGSEEATAWAVIDWIAPVNPILAWRCIIENGLSKEHPSALALMIPRANARAAPQARFEWGITHAQNDQRPGIGVRNGLPDILWCEIPGGSFKVQAKSPSEAGKDKDVATFFISRYPITVAQFQVFVDDTTDGYSNSKWWEDFSRELDAPTPPQFQYATHPRNMVNWYEAVAFCNWLSSCLGFHIRLPEEHEWEKAACGRNPRKYPYGDEFDPTKGNTIETGLDMTSAVGIFPDGDSPYCVSDCCGNVSEWCYNDYVSDGSYVIFDPFNLPMGSRAQTLKPIRGGSWNSDFYRATTYYRASEYAVRRRGSIGFRIAATSVSSSASVIACEKDCTCYAKPRVL